MRNDEALKSRQSVIKKIISCWETKGESIQRAVNVGFSKNIDTITIREKKLRKLKELSFLKDTIFRDGETLLTIQLGAGQDMFRRDSNPAADGYRNGCLVSGQDLRDYF